MIGLLTGSRCPAWLNATARLIRGCGQFRAFPCGCIGHRHCTVEGVDRCRTASPVLLARSHARSIMSIMVLPRKLRRPNPVAKSEVICVSTGLDELCAIASVVTVGRQSI